MAAQFTSDGPDATEALGAGLAALLGPGDVVVLRGDLGAGKTTLFNCLTGFMQAASGRVLLGGVSIAGRPSSAVFEAGLARTFQIVQPFAGLSVRENIIIALQAKLGWFRALNRDEQDEIAGRYADALDIRAANYDMPVKLLSGGNQQKVILARWLAIDPSFLILDEPTRGIDVGAHAEIVRTINRLREDGLALLVISSELDEVVAYSNRVVVMRDREMVAELRGADVAPSVIVAAIAEDTGTLGAAE